MELNYQEPQVTLLHASPLWVAEVAARTAYDSFDKSEHSEIRTFPILGTVVNDIPSSAILHQLAWVHHHHSVIELIDLTYSIKGISRGVLQEHARHRMQSLTVRSTRYTMSGVLNAYITSSLQWGLISKHSAVGMFTKLVKELDVMVYDCDDMLLIECTAMYDKLYAQVGEDYSSMLSKEGNQILATIDDMSTLFSKLQKAKKKRNVGDDFKHIVTDNWKVDLICKFNLRSLKNYIGLRDSGAAWFQIQWLAEAIQKTTPAKYLDLIVKSK